MIYSGKHEEYYSVEMEHRNIPVTFCVEEHILWAASSMEMPKKRFSFAEGGTRIG